MKLAVSFLASENYKKCIEKINKTDAEYLHVDMCDGKYTENKNFTMSELLKALKVSEKPLDVHMMVSSPLKYVNDLAFLDVDTITFHVDASCDINEAIDYISGIGIKVGLAINPDIKVDDLLPYLNKIDRVLVMSVVPGKGGQAFISDVLEKFDKLNELKEKYHFETSIDGGVNDEVISLIKEKNVDVVVCGSYITNSLDYNENISLLKNI